MDVTLGIEDPKAALAAFPGAVLDYPFGPRALVYKVGGKMFALVVEMPEGPRISLKADPFLAESLRQAYPAIKPGYHMNKRHWNTLHLAEGVPADVLWNMLAGSYDLVRASLPRRVQAEIAAAAAAAAAAAEGASD